MAALLQSMKRGNLLHKQGFVDFQMVTTIYFTAKKSSSDKREKRRKICKLHKRQSFIHLKRYINQASRQLHHVHKKSSDINSFPMIVKQLLDKRGQLIVQSRPKRLVEYLVAGLISKQDRRETQSLKENTKNHCTVNQGNAFE